MLLRLLSLALLPAALIASGCARHVNRPDSPPPEPTRRDWGVEPDLVFTPPDWPARLLADLYTPVGPAPAGGWPAVVLIHGGGWRSGDRDQVKGLAERIAARGYVTLNVTYRLVPAAIFPAQLLDVQRAIAWLRNQAPARAVNPARIGIWGYSAGAHLAALAGSLSPGDRYFAEDARVAAIVAGGIPSDLRKFKGGTLVPDFLGERWSADSVAFRDASPAAQISAGDPPVFLYHGSWDTLVPFDQATDYQRALDAAGIANELYVLRGLGHIPAFLMDGTAVQRGLDFLDRHLR